MLHVSAILVWIYQKSRKKKEPARNNSRKTLPKAKYSSKRQQNTFHTSTRNAYKDSSSDNAMHHGSENNHYDHNVGIEMNSFAHDDFGGFGGNDCGFGEGGMMGQDPSMMWLNCY